MKPRKIGDKTCGACSAAKAKIKRRKKKASELKTKILESNIVNTLQKAERIAAGLSSRGAAVLRGMQTYNERESTRCAV